MGLFVLVEKGKKSEKIEKDFSFLITDEFMFICKRKEYNVFITEKDKKNNDIINLNSLAFFFCYCFKKFTSNTRIKGWKYCK